MLSMRARSLLCFGASREETECGICCSNRTGGLSARRVSKRRWALTEDRASQPIGYLEDMDNLCTSNDPVELLKEIVRRIVEVAKPDRIIMFGSRARGDARSDSDVDLLVVKSNVLSRREIADRIYVKLIGIPVPIDVVVVTPDDISKYAAAVGTIIPTVLKEGIEIYAA